MSSKECNADFQWPMLPRPEMSDAAVAWSSATPRCLILFLLTITTSIQHHPTRYSHPPKKSGCVGTSWCHVFHQLHGLHPAGRHDSPQQHVLRLQRLHRTQEMQGRWPGGTGGTAAGDGGSENRSDLQGDSESLGWTIDDMISMWSYCWEICEMYSWWSMFWGRLCGHVGKIDDYHTIYLI